MAVNRKKLFVLAVLLCAGGVSSGLTQTPAPTPKRTPTPVKPKVWSPPGFPAPPSFPRETQQTTEKFIAVDPNVNIKLCISEGNLKVNGWERDEVRVFVRSGRLPGFKVLEKDAASGKPNWLMIANKAAEGARPAPRSECLSGSTIELDVPVKSSINLTGRSTETVIDSLKKATVKTVEGDITLRNIVAGISAETYQGNLMVEGSGGAIMLSTTSGNILASGVNPGQIGDLFRAKAGNGNITLQQVEHRQIEANSISGTVNFSGKFLPGGLYSFKTSSGPIKLQTALKSSFVLRAQYGFGAFHTEIPLNYDYQNETDGGKSFLARVGTGDANITLTTSTGSIVIRKQ